LGGGGAGALNAHPDRVGTGRRTVGGAGPLASIFWAASSRLDGLSGGESRLRRVETAQEVATVAEDLPDDLKSGRGNF